jgi:uncharacterized protein involved in outer membrane biogenesis
MWYWWRRRSKFLLVTGILAAIVATILIALPEVLRRVAIAKLNNLLTVPVSIEDVDLNLFTRHGTVSKLVIGPPDSPEPLLSLPRLDFKFSPLRLVVGDLLFYNISLSEPSLLLQRNGPTHFNLMDAVRFPKEKATRSGGETNLRFTVDQFSVRNGTLKFVDRTVSPRVERNFKAITLKAGKISSMPKFVLTPTSFRVGFRVADGAVTLIGEATPIARPANVQVVVNWKNIQPEIFEAYLPDRPIINLSKSSSSGEVRYVLVHGKQQENYASASFTVGPVAISAPGADQALIRVNTLGIKKAHWDFLRNQGRIDELALKSPDVLVRRGVDGSLNLSTLFTTSNERNDTDSKDQTGLPLTLALLKIDAGRVAFVDEFPEPNVNAVFQNVRLNLQNLSIRPGASPAKLHAKAQLGKSAVRIDGTLQLYPLKTRLAIATRDLPLKPYEGYLKTGWKAFQAWRGDLEGNIDLALASENEAVTVAIKGDIAARNFSLETKDGAEQAPLTAQNIHIRLASLRTYPAFFLDLEGLEINGANLRIRRNSKGTLNVSALLGSGESQSSLQQEKPSPSGSRINRSSEPQFAIRSLTVKNSSAEFVDTSVQPPFDSRLSDLHIEVGKLGRQTGSTPVRLSAAINESAKLDLRGSIQPFETPVTIKLDGTIRDYDLSELNPYATKFIEYRIQRGRVSTDVQYTYDGGDLNGKNQIAIRRLQLGDRTGGEFEEKVGIPLRLAISLLQDANGTIRLAIPVNGNLKDPHFELAGMIWRAVRNAIVKLVTAPLRLLGNVVTLGGRITRIDIDPVEFEPGSATLKPEGEKQLKELADLLKEKPGLDLEVRAAASPREVQALKLEKLRDQLRGSGESYELIIRRLYRMAIQNMKNPPKAANLKEMETYLARNSTLEQGALQALADERAAIIERRLSGAGIENRRLYVNSEVSETESARAEFDFLS